MCSWNESHSKVFNSILKSGRYPDAWRVAVVAPLLKGSTLNASCVDNYRGIALLCTLSKVFANVLDARITSFLWATKQIACEHFGFTWGRRTIDPAFIFDTLISKAKIDNKKLFVAFIDFRKAYDFVFREGLFVKLLRAGVSGNVFKVLYSMYDSVLSVVRQGSDVSEMIVQLVGLRQGCILSPCLFSLFLADLPTFLRESGAQGVGLHDEVVRCLFYADDGALVADTAEDLQLMLNILKII